MKNIVLTGIIALLLAGNAYSQELPKIPDQVKFLYSFEGTWEGAASVTMGSDVNTGTGKYVWSKIADGWGMFIDEKVDIPAMGKVYLGHNIIGYHMGEGMYHLYTIDNFGDVHDHKGNMTDDKNMKLVYEGLTPDGKQYKENLGLTVISPTECKLWAEAIVMGKTEYIMNINLKKSN
jgi:hypothetical protein